MSIRMIAIDLDGTLLHDDMSISAYSCDVIRRAMEKGYKVVIATGRMWDSARLKVDLLSLGNVPVICYTGAWIMMSETGKTVEKEEMEPVLAEKILQSARGKGWHITSFMDDQIYMDQPDGTEIKYRKYRSRQPVFVGEEFYHPKKPVTRIVFSNPSFEERKRIREELEKEFGNKVDIVFPGDDFIDVHKKGINKAEAVRFLCRKEGFTMDEVMAFGNTENDVPLLKEAGLSYAVANADDIAKDAAKEICPSNEEDGVARTIEKMLDI